MENQIDAYAEQLNTNFANELVQFYYEKLTVLGRELREKNISMDFNAFVNFNLAPLNMLIIPAVMTICDSLIRQGKQNLDVKVLAKEVLKDFGLHLPTSLDTILTMMQSTH